MFNAIRSLFILVFSALALMGAAQQTTPVSSDSIPQDASLLGFAPQRALIVTAHDDDAVAFAGTVALLDSNGWATGFLCFPSADTARNFRHLLASSYIVDTTSFMSGTMAQFRTDGLTNKTPHVPLAVEKFAEVYLLHEITEELAERINAFNPTVIFTLDNEMGGYGHPDHVMVSQVVRNLAETGRIHPKAIYQGVYSDEIEQEIIEERLGRKLEKMALPNTFHIAKGVYQVEGIPAPEVRVDVSASQEAKTYYLELYGQQGGNDLNRFMHDFEKYNASKFHDLFMWEYFRVLSY